MNASSEGPGQQWAAPPSVTPPGQPHHAAPAPGQRTSGKAIAALVLGIVGLIILPIVCSVLAIIFGALARGETQRDPTLGGRGMATAGLVCGIVGVAIWPLLLIAIYA